jgi:branched-chain amino acid transport system permease protein
LIPGRLFVALAAVALLVAVPFGQTTYGLYVLCSWLVFSIAAMGLNLTLGYAGQVSLAQAAFLGIGAYATALMTMAGVHWILAAAASGALCFIIGLGLGYPALRVQHHFLAFVTLAFNTLVFLVLRNEEWLTNGSYGIMGIPRPEFLGITTEPQFSFYFLVLAVFVLMAGALYGIVRSPWGRAFRALRENPVRANSLGIDLRRMTLLAFAIGSAFGGVAGALLAPLVQFIDPNSFSLNVSLKILLMVIVGGAGFFPGPILGALLVVVMPEFLRFTEGYYLIVYAGAVIALMVFCPSGLLGLWDRLLTSMKARRQGGVTVWEASP